MRAVSGGLAFLMFAACVPPAAHAQETTVHRALVLEDSGQWAAAAALYRQALDSDEMLQAVYGLERALITLNRGEELAGILERLARRHPDQPDIRAMYVRTLRTLGRANAARAFVTRWIGERPLDPEGYRQLFALGPLTAADARMVWRNVRARADDSSQVIADELSAHVASDGLWAVAREILTDRYRRDADADVAAELAYAHARAGEVDDARALISGAALSSAAEVHGWLALYAGDLAGARPLLRNAADADVAAVLPLAAVARAGNASSPDFGRGLLLLVRGDTSGAARAFARAAPSLGDAAPLVLAWAARLHLANGDRAPASALYDTVMRDHPQSPEAPEALLDQARRLARSGSREAAIERLEHLLVTYPHSAEVPRARRELETLRPANGR